MRKIRKKLAVMEHKLLVGEALQNLSHIHCIVYEYSKNPQNSCSQKQAVCFLMKRAYIWKEDDKFLVI